MITIADGKGSISGTAWTVPEDLAGQSVILTITDTAKGFAAEITVEIISEEN